MVNFCLRLINLFGHSGATVIITIPFAITAFAITYFDSIAFGYTLFSTIYLCIYIPPIIAPPIINFLIAVVIKLDNFENKMAAITKSAGDAIFIHHDKGNLIEINDTACRSLGYQRDELLALHVSDFEVQTDLEDVRKYWHELVQDKEISLEGDHRLKDGSTFPSRCGWPGPVMAANSNLWRSPVMSPSPGGAKQIPTCSMSNWRMWRAWLPWGKWPPVSSMN